MATTPQPPSGEAKGRSDGAASSGETLEGSVERVVYHAEDTRYLVMRLRASGHDTLITVVGRGMPPEAGAKVELSGSWDVHPQHGRQFRFGSLQLEVPKTTGGVIRRLMRYPGIKETMATRIVARYGLDTLDILDKQPRRFLEVEGIGQKTLDRIVDHHGKTGGPLGKLEAQLLELDMPPYLADPIHKRYGETAIQTLREQPYKMTREVRGIGFATADRIARALGLSTDSEDRVDAGILHVLDSAESDGHCAVPIDWLVPRATAALGVGEALVRAGGDRLVRSGELVLEHGSDGVALCFPHRFVVAERSIAQALCDLATAPREVWAVPKTLPPDLSAGQRAVIGAVAERGAVVLTGGPGTGKSTVVKEILGLARDNDVEVVLCAPTGRAAKRLEQTTGHQASTIHRLLEVQADSGRFAKGPHDPLDPGLLVVDEASMLDVNLADALLSALTPEHRLLIVGDADQLPSVGPGNVLRDIMAAAGDGEGPIGIVRLTEIFRQAEGSSIVANAHRILHGERPVADAAGGGGEFFVVHARDRQKIHDMVVKMAAERMPEAYGLDARVDVQVLCPMHKGPVGTEAFNRSLQNLHTAGQPELEYRPGGKTVLRRFRKGDRVMQMRNDYDKGVYNGDVGVVRAVDSEEGECTVEIDGERVRYAGRDLMALQLAYAVSIHKSQGSEFPAVIVPLVPEHHVMLRRNLLYTAVTRARRLCVVAGDPRAIDRAISIDDAGQRHTGLTRRLGAVLGQPLEDPSAEPAESEADFGPMALPGDEPLSAPDSPPEPEPEPEPEP
ncbi:MAG: ATP-dependent RecD-like DNA helicase, partial [Myxococcota bacterium]